MSKKHLRSDASNDEIEFLFSGAVLIGEGNHLTELFKLVGKFDELKELGRKKEIVDYAPEKDKRFMYENRGYCVIGDILKKTDEGRGLSRKYLRNLSRKWCGTAVVLSFKSHYIISELVAYINQDDDLYRACIKHVKQIEGGWVWERLMPIQYGFISRRHKDKHKNFRVAEAIINELARISL